MTSTRDGPSGPQSLHAGLAKTFLFNVTYSASSASSGISDALASFLMAMRAPQALEGFPLPRRRREPTSPLSPMETWGKAKKTSGTVAFSS